MVFIETLFQQAQRLNMVDGDLMTLDLIKGNPAALSLQGVAGGLAPDDPRIVNEIGRKNITAAPFPGKYGDDTVQFYIQPGLFFYFPERRRFHFLPQLQESSRQAQPQPVAAVDQQHFICIAYDHVHADKWRGKMPQAKPIKNPLKSDNTSAQDAEQVFDNGALCDLGVHIKALNIFSKQKYFFCVIRYK